MKKELAEAVGTVTDLVISFDTTGSMNPCIADVREHLRKLVVQMSKDIKGLKIGIIAHGDYCDGPNCIKSIDLTTDHDAVIDFINKTPDTGGGDADECYELAISKAADMSWSGSNGAFVLIGDASPHGPDYPQNTDHLDWRKELARLKKKTRVYGMQCLRMERNPDNGFWEALAEESGTPLLQLGQFDESAETLGAVAYAASGDKKLFSRYKDATYSARVATRGVVAPTMCMNFDSLEASMESPTEEKAPEPKSDPD